MNRKSKVFRATGAVLSALAVLGPMFVAAPALADSDSPQTPTDPDPGWDPNWIGVPDHIIDTSVFPAFEHTHLNGQINHGPSEYLADVCNETVELISSIDSPITALKSRCPFCNRELGDCECDTWNFSYDSDMGLSNFWDS